MPSKLPIPKMGTHKNKSQKVGTFLAAQNHQTKHHNYHAFHHKLTTFLPPQNTIKSQNPLRKPTLPPRKIFSPKSSPCLTFPPSKPIGKWGSYAGSEVVLPYRAPET
jgi:hypothetical protein